MDFEAGDFLVFQVESGFGLLRVLGIDSNSDGEKIWHISAYEDLFLDVEMADAALQIGNPLTISIPHAALTNRAFLSTQVSKLTNTPLEEIDLQHYKNWRENQSAVISDRSIRLMLGLR